MRMCRTCRIRTATPGADVLTTCSRRSQVARSRPNDDPAPTAIVEGEAGSSQRPAEIPECRRDSPPPAADADQACEIVVRMAHRDAGVPPWTPVRPRHSLQYATATATGATPSVRVVPAHASTRTRSDRRVTVLPFHTTAQERARLSSRRRHAQGPTTNAGAFCMSSVFVSARFPRELVSEAQGARRARYCSLSAVIRLAVQRYVAESGSIARASQSLLTSLPTTQKGRRDDS